MRAILRLPMAPVEVEGLTKTYGNLRAVDGISFAIGSLGFVIGSRELARSEV